MNINVNNVLSTIERRILDASRLIENDEYNNALELIPPLKLNLERIKAGISNQTFEILKDNLNAIETFCQEKAINNNPTCYFADLVHNGGEFHYNM